MTSIPIMAHTRQQLSEIVSSFQDETKFHEFISSNNINVKLADGLSLLGGAYIAGAFDAHFTKSKMIKVCKTLLNYDIDINSIDDIGRTVADYFCGCFNLGFHNPILEVFKLLMINGAKHSHSLPVIREVDGQIIKYVEPTIYEIADSTTAKFLAECDYGTDACSSIIASFVFDIDIIYQGVYDVERSLVLDVMIGSF